jgi:small conductance mechanosensitive channel
MDLTNVAWIDLTSYIDIAVQWFIGYLPKIIGALLVLWIGFKIINILEKGITKLMDKQKLNPMLKSFVTSLSNMLLKIMVIIAAAWILWVQTSSFVAMLAAAWFAVGMALSGTLQNFAWWVMILMLKPFRIGHYVEIWWFAWVVKEISIFNTTLLTPDKKRIIIPNSDISNWSMTNYSAEPKRRIDMVIWVSYDDNIELVKKTLLEIAENHENVLQDHKITIWLNEFWDNSVNFNYRVFVKSEDYWATKYNILETIKTTFDKKKISFPFPQRDVHLYNEK